MPGDDIEPKLVRHRGKWAIRYHEGGQRRRWPTGTARRDAAEAVLGEWLRLRQGKPTTVADCYERYFSEHGKGTANPERVALGWAALRSAFGHRRVSSLAGPDVARYVAGRRDDRVADGTIRKELGILRTALRYCEQAGYIDRAPHIPLPPQPPPRERYLTRDEAARLLDACITPHVRLAVLLGLHTAARRGAILDLTWDRVDLERGFVDFRTHKARRKGRATLPLGPTLLAALREARPVAISDHVIEYDGKPVATISKSFERAARRAGLEGVTFHTLRHTSAVWLAEAGVAMSVIAQYLGHSSTATTERVYARYSPDYLRQAVSVLEGS